MYTLTSYVKITDPTGSNYLEFTFVNAVEIELSRRTLTNKAKITMPRKLKILNGDINTIIQRGAKVLIQLGYDDNNFEEFSGYVSNVGAQIPLTIDCEDEMWVLKQNSFTKTYKSIKVAQVVADIYTGQTQVVDLTIGDLVVKQQSTAQILDALTKFGLQCYFLNGVLIVDFAGAVHQGNEVIYNFNKNIIDSANLEYKRKDDARIKVQAVSKLHTGKKIEVIVGDNDGELHTLNYVNMTKNQLTLVAQSEIDKLKYDGYKGSFKTLGLPRILPGDIAVLQDDNYPEHDGSYLTEAVKIIFGTDGYRREISPERKVA